MSEFNLSDTERCLGNLILAVELKRSLKTCLRHWSCFVRARDDYKCILCGSGKRVSAHHIVRKSFLPQAALLTGNGITLCEECHRYAHIGFNGKPDLLLPMDMQNGEKIDLLAELYARLLADAESRGLLREDFYFLSDEVLTTFMTLQGFTSPINLVNSRLALAVAVWRYSPDITRAVIEANGFAPPPEILTTGNAIVYWT